MTKILEMTPSIQQWTARPVPGTLRTELGESPRYDADRHLLCWVDILRGIVIFARPVGDLLVDVRSVRVPDPVSAVNPVRGGDGYLLAARTGVWFLDHDGSTWQVLQIEPPAGGTRTNEAVGDPWGRLWLGTMGLDGARDRGSVYCLRPDGQWDKEFGPVSISNGTAFSSDRQRMYYVDSHAPAVVVRDCDPNDGSIGPPRAFIELPGGIGDGMCRDDDDCLWIAVHEAGQVRRFAPDGSHIGTVTVPDAPLVTACALAGGRLFITTAHVDMTDDELRSHPGSGLLHVADVGITGPPAATFGAGRDKILHWPGVSGPASAAKGTP